MSLLDFIFPKYCVGCKKIGEYVCASCFSYITFIEAGFCIVCQRQSIDCRTHPVCKTRYALDGTFSSIVYNGVVKRLVYQFKYKPYVTDLQELLVDLTYEGLIQKEIFFSLLKTNSVFVPIPLYKNKLKKRGYNQAELLAKGLAKRFSSPVADALERVKNTQTQVGLTQIQRVENIKNAFEIKKEFSPSITGMHQVFLIDDIATSGATLLEAGKVLKKAGIKNVWGITLAKGK